MPWYIAGGGGVGADDARRLAGRTNPAILLVSESVKSVNSSLLSVEGDPCDKLSLLFVALGDADLEPLDARGFEEREGW